MAISAHDDEIRRDIHRVGKNGACHVGSLDDNPLEVNVELMTSQMTSDVGVRQLVTFERLSRHDHHLDSFGAVQKRQYIRYRARGLAPSVPAHQNDRV